YSTLAPDIAVRALIGFETDLMDALLEGRADIADMYTPQARPGLTVELLLEERLVMVSTRPSPSAELLADYVFVDWGPELFAQHSLAFPRFAGGALTVHTEWPGT